MQRHGLDCGAPIFKWGRIATEILTGLAEQRQFIITIRFCARRKKNTRLQAGISDGRRRARNLPYNND